MKKYKEDIEDDIDEIEYYLIEANAKISSALRELQYQMNRDSVTIDFMDIQDYLEDGYGDLTDLRTLLNYIDSDDDYRDNLEGKPLKG